MVCMGDHRLERPHDADLRRQCAAIVDALGLRVRGTLRSPPGVCRVVVEGADLPRPAVLCVRVGEGFPDTEARLAIASEHLDAVRDVPAPVGSARSARRPPVYARIGEYLPGGNLRVLLEGGALGVGEAVTVLLAVLDVLHQAHHAGFGGVEPRADRIRFRADGCPVVTGFPGLGPLSAERARHDTEAFRQLVREVARSLPGADAAVLCARADGALGGGATALRRALLDVAPPVAVRLRAVEKPIGEGIDGSSGRRMSGARRPRQAPGVRRVGDVLLDGRPLREARAAVVGLIRRRPKLVLVAAVPLVAATVAFVALPPSADVEPAPAAQPAAPTTASSAPAPVPASTVPAAEDGECAAGDVFDLTGDASQEEPDAECALRADEPVEAALEWLAAHGGSSGQGVRAEVAQRWGEAVLVRVEPGPEGSPDSEPASLLLVRGEAGWRIRAVYS
jgi:hypothetical protein